ncbi:MAG: dTMP kinase [Candidatus Desulfofervidus auxilii]|nr:dTMP kinase [Candidatus Desulfofervidus auxilii]
MKIERLNLLGIFMLYILSAPARRPCLPAGGDKAGRALLRKMNLFITFEGIEGAGKTTQSMLLAEWLKKRGREVCVTYEPGHTPLGQRIREILLSDQFSSCAEAELLLYLADRAEHVKKMILPALTENKFVLCDRYHDSTLAYQGYGRGIKIEFIWNCLFSLGFPLPHFTFLLDCPVEIGLKRIKNRTLDRMEKQTLLFHNRVREGFLKLAKADPKRIKVIDVTMPIKDIQTEIRTYVAREYGI